MKRKIIFSVLIMIIMVIAIVFYQIFKSQDINIIDEKAEYKLSVEQLYGKFEENEVEAGKLFIGRVIEVEGSISDIQLNQQNNKIIVLKGPDDLFGVLCTLRDNSNIEDSNIGDNLKIKGICKGFLTDVILNNCVVVK